MTDDPLAAFPAFVQLLSACPDPEAVAEALTLGPLMPLEPTGTHLYRRVDHPVDATGELVSIGSRGLSDELRQRYSRLDLTLDLPVVHAVLTSQVVVTPVPTLVEDYPPLSIDAPTWRELATRPNVDGGIIVCVPAVSRGRSVGAVTFLAPRRQALDGLERRVVDLVGHLLGLWLQACVLARIGRNNHDGGPPAGRPLLALTERQSAVLALVAQGKSNAAIAATLGFALSTIKQDITRMNSALGVRSRGELVERALQLGLLPAGSAV